MPGAKGRSGRKRKTSAELKASGGYKKCRHDDRLDANHDQSGRPSKPKSLTAEQTRLWDAIIEAMPEAAIGSADTPMMREMVRWYGVYCKQMQLLKDDPLDAKLVTACQKSWGEVRKLAIDYGLTPQARAQIKIPKSDDKENNPFEAIVARMTGPN